LENIRADLPQAAQVKRPGRYTGLIACSGKRAGIACPVNVVPFGCNHTGAIRASILIDDGIGNVDTVGAATADHTDLIVVDDGIVDQRECTLVVIDADRALSRIARAVRDGHIADRDVVIDGKVGEGLDAVCAGVVVKRGAGYA